MWLTIITNLVDFHHLISTLILNNLKSNSLYINLLFYDENKTKIFIWVQNILIMNKLWRFVESKIFDVWKKNLIDS